jgi:hypothetical protein
MDATSEQDQQVREWAAAYRAWNEREIARRRTTAGRQPLEKKLSAFFDLCEMVRQLAGPKTAALYQAQLRTHVIVQDRIRRLERHRSRGKSSA